MIILIFTEGGPSLEDILLLILFLIFPCQRVDQIDILVDIIICLRLQLDMIDSGVIAINQRVIGITYWLRNLILSDQMYVQIFIIRY